MIKEKEVMKETQYNDRNTYHHFYNHRGTEANESSNSIQINSELDPSQDENDHQSEFENALQQQHEPLLSSFSPPNFHRRLSPRDDNYQLPIDESMIPFRKIPSDENLTNHHYSTRYSVLGFTTPLTINWFYSIIGAEYCHIYFWLIKDLSWMQSWLYLSIFFGSLALIWSFLILYHSLRTFNWHELWNFTALFMWLFANFWWMIGEAHDYQYPDEFPVSIQHTDTSAVILTAALIWELFYYMIILPFNLLPCSKQALLEYDDGTLQPRFPCFRNFRQYENLHMLFWIAKDLAWNRLKFEMWIISVIPTILIAADFIYISAKNTKHDAALDITHFTAVLIWVVGNSLWAYGDFFVDDLTNNDIHPIVAMANMIFRYARFYSSWILFIGMIPILLMYGVWGTLTLSGRLGRFYREDSSLLSHSIEMKEQESMLGSGNVISSYTSTQLTGRNTATSHTNTPEHGTTLVKPVPSSSVELSGGGGVIRHGDEMERVILVKAKSGERNNSIDVNDLIQ